ncbi:MAG: ArnT family glycosyltransferase [Acidobacteriota bacterium]
MSDRRSAAPPPLAHIGKPSLAWRPTLPGGLWRVPLVALIAWSVTLPLRDVLAYPDRVAVLPNLQTDAEAYHAIALELARTWSVDALPPRHPPGWVALLAVLYSTLGPSYVVGKLVSWTVLLGLVAACGWLAGRLYGTRAAAWTAALLCAASPALRGYVGTLQYEVVTGGLLLTTIVLALRAIASPSYGRAACTGAAGALLVLTREPFAIVVPLIALWVATQTWVRVGTRNALVIAAVTIAVSLAPPVLWSASQSLRYGAFVPISEKGPITVEIGNNPRANGTYNTPLVGIGQPTGLAFVGANPWRSIVLATRKVLYFWGVLRDGWNVPRPAAVWAWRATTGLVPLPVWSAASRGGWLLAAFLIGLWMLGRAGLRVWWGVPVTVLAVMAVHVATLSSHRFAVPVLPLVFAVAAGPVAAAARWTGMRLQSAAVAAATVVLVTVVVGMQVQPWPLQLTLRAHLLDGLEADNVVDAVAGEEVRWADAARGLRPIVLLTDEYLPRGVVSLDVELRRSASAQSPASPAVRVALVDLDGRPACARDLAIGDIPADRFDVTRLSCRLRADGPFTLAVYALGTVDLGVKTIRLAWM